jgi:hypothetical protein
MSETYHVFSVLDFEDDTISIQKLASGTREECERTCRLISAIMYNGEKKVRRSLLRIISASELDYYFEENQIPNRHDRPDTNNTTLYN